MNVCIIGDGLVSLALAKALVNEGVYVDVFSSQKTNKISKSRTLGISEANVEYFNKNILEINKLLWKINKIEIYSENLKNEKILNFDNNKKELFSIIKNHELYDNLISSLKKNKFFKKKVKFKNTLLQKYKLIINCDTKSFFTKKYFYKKLNKNYQSLAFTTIIDHKKLLKNDTAVQIFTKKGPLAFLPISEKKTSIVYSARGQKKINLENLIKKFNSKYEITNINQISNFELIASDLRKYHFKNILAFGDLLHKVHPLAGQGFNMSIRDIKLLMKLIKLNLNLGLELSNSICINFEKKIKHKNYLFSNGIDFVYEFFNLESKFNNTILSQTIKMIGKNKSVKKFFTRLADHGLSV